MPFAVTDQIRLDAFVFAREHRTGAGEPGLDLVGDEHHVVLPAPVQQRGQEAVGRNDEAALTLNGFDDHRGKVVGADLLVHHRDRALGRQFAVGGHLLAELGVAERVRQRSAVDLRRERAEAVLVGHRLRGQRHGQVGAPVIGVIERHDGRLTCVGPGDLDRVLHRLRPRVEQRRPLLAAAGREAVELFGDRDVALVRRDHEAGVGEVGGLLGHGRDHPGRRVADRGDRDARTEVDEPVAVDVLDDAAERPGRVDRHGVADCPRHGGALPVDQRLRAGPGYRVAR